MADTQTVVQANPDSMKLARNFKGEIAWEIKVYGDAKDAPGRAEMADRLEALEKNIKTLAKKNE